MTPLPLPVNPGVRFLELDDFPGYAVSEDGQVWRSSDTSWHPLKSYVNYRGNKAVWLILGRGSSMVELSALLQRFTEKEANRECE